MLRRRNFPWRLKKLPPVPPPTTTTEKSVEPPTLVSACLLGTACRYDGRSKPHPLPGVGVALPVCPEVMAGFGIPRPPIERGDDGRVRVLETGEDVTDALEKAAATIVSLAQSRGVEHAILKERSPSCGSSELHRDGRIVSGEGILTERLRAAGILVESE